LSVSDYRPLSKLGKHDDALDTLHEDVMPWMLRALQLWAAEYLWEGSYSNTDLLQAMELDLRPFDPWMARGSGMADDVSDRIGRESGMDIIGWLVANIPKTWEYESKIEALAAILKRAGSAWEPTRVAEGEWRLTRRDLAAAKDAIASVGPLSARVNGFLTSAWQQVATREPDPGGAYDQAVKAVEAAAQPVVLPTSAKATLGTIIKALEDKPEKWDFALDDLETVIAMCRTLWTKHYRHGTQLREDHTLEEADAALHLAIPLCRFFAGGLVTRHP
jgi:hypothetical protein